jgi:hypothetical protein
MDDGDTEALEDMQMRDDQFVYHTIVEKNTTPRDRG